MTRYMSQPDIKKDAGDDPQMTNKDSEEKVWIFVKVRNLLVTKTKGKNQKGKTKAEIKKKMRKQRGEKAEKTGNQKREDNKGKNKRGKQKRGK